jgi:hypothetical protein
MPSSPL